MNDIDLSAVAWTPVGTSSVQYAGNFDGQGYKLTLAVDNSANGQGLFGYVKSASIKNIVTAGTVKGSGSVAGVVGWMGGASVIENCVNEATVSGASDVGGVIGYMSGASSVTACANKGAVSASGSYAGGVIGELAYSCTDAVVSNCINQGTVSGESGYVGGITGASCGTITACANKGAVSGAKMVGGIIGAAKNATAVSDCYNTGAVTASAATSDGDAAGIIGYVGTKSVAVSNCYNTGAITGGAAAAKLVACDTRGIALSNCYYVGVAADVAHSVSGEGVVAESDTVYAKTADEMKVAAAVFALNAERAGDDAVWRVDASGDDAINDGFPVLAWQERSAALIRIAGDYARDTSALISGEAFPDGECGSVVLARDDDFRDAMSAAGLAGALGCPVLLTSRDGLSDVAAAEVERLGAKTAYVIGGPGAMPGDFESELDELGCAVERVWGEQSYDTSVECARRIAELGGSDEDAAVVAYGQNFQDALSMSSFAYRHKVPIFLQTFGATSDERGLTDEAVSLINGSFPGTLYVAGGEGAVSSASLEAVGFDERSGDVRLWGEDGYATSLAIADYMVETGLLEAGSVVVASGALQARGLDALSGAALAGGLSAPVLLVNGQAAFGAVDVSAVEGFLAKHDVGRAYVLGGAYVVPDDTVLNPLAEALG